MASSITVKPEPSDGSTPIPSPAAPSAARRPAPSSKLTSKVKRKPASPAPPSNFSDYRLVSSGLAQGYDAPSGTPRFNVVKFQSSHEVDPRSFDRPVGMNRRDPRPRPPPTGSTTDVKPEPGQAEEEKKEDLRPVLDAQGRVVRGEDGQPLMAPKQVYDAALVGGSATGQPLPVRKKKDYFKKKTKQVYKVDSDVIRLRREERYPWVLESAEGKEAWVGRMEDTAEKQSYVSFVFEDDKDEFEVVDVRRWFKFQKRAAYETLGVDEAEELYARVGKGKDPRRWLMHDPTRASTPASGSTSNQAANPSGASSSSAVANGSGGPISLPRVKREESMPGWMRRSAKVEALENGGGPGGLSLPGGRGRSRVKSEPGIKQEEGGGWEEDEGEVRRGGRRNSDGGADGENDQDFDDEFSDDDGLVEFDQADAEENKELEEKLKREFRQGNAQGKDAVSDDEDLFGELDDSGKAIKRVLRRNRRRRGGDGDDDSDNDRDSNPYASSEEESSDEDVGPEATQPALDDQGQQAFITLPDGTRIAAPPVRKPPQPTPSTSTTRYPSPAPPSVGAQLLAQRATSPHRSGSSRSASRDRRTASPGATSSREGSPSASSAGVNKRKSTPDLQSAGGAGGDDHKRPRTDEINQPPTVRKLSGPSERVIVEYIRKFSPDIPQLIKHFKKSLKSPIAEQTAANKAALIETTKKVATFDGSKIFLRPEYAATPPA